MLSSIGTRWISGDTWLSLGCELAHDTGAVQHFCESPHRHFHRCDSFLLLSLLPCRPIWSFNAAPLRRMSLSCVVPAVQVVFISLTEPASTSRILATLSSCTLRCRFTTSLQLVMHGPLENDRRFWEVASTAGRVQLRHLAVQHGHAVKCFTVVDHTGTARLPSASLRAELWKSRCTRREVGLPQAMHALTEMRLKARERRPHSEKCV